MPDTPELNPGPVLRIPRTSLPGIHWPALPAPADAAVLALLYQLEQSQWWPADQLEQLQLHQLGILVNHCRAHIPFYRNRLPYVDNRRYGLSSDAFVRIPILTRRDLQHHGQKLINPSPPEEHLPTGNGRTSGATGRSIGFRYSRITGLFYRALNLRFHLWHKRDFTGKMAAIRNPRLAGNDGRRGNAGAWLRVFRSGPFVELSAHTPVNEQMRWLMDENPEFLLTYPSNLLALIKYGESAGIAAPGLRGVDTTSEVMSQEIRAETRRSWGLDPKDIYSCMETGIIALQCPDHPCYHVQSENVIVEILDDNDRPCPPGEIGRVVVTDLHNFAMPLIRYAIGDYAEAAQPCRCGRTLPVLSRILGRSRNMLVMPSGEQLWPILPVSEWTRTGPINQIQVIQHSIDEIEVLVASDGPLPERTNTELTKRIDAFFDHAFTIRLTRCDRIERSASGKFEDFKSLILPPADS